MSLSWKVKLAVVYDGWKNVIFPTKEIEEIAKARAIICSKCDSNVGHVCKECTCPIHAKCRSMREENKCDLGKWEE